jgi:hypothetical protein
MEVTPVLYFNAEKKNEGNDGEINLDINVFSRGTGLICCVS